MDASAFQIHWIILLLISSQLVDNSVMCLEATGALEICAGAVGPGLYSGEIWLLPKQERKLRDLNL